MRLPFIFSDVSFSFRRLRTTPARKPRTECFCHPVAFIIPAMVAPAGVRSNAMTRDCFEWGLTLLALAVAASFWEAFAAREGAVEDKASLLLADAVNGILRLVRFTAARAASPKPHLGNRAGGAGFQSARGARNWRQYRSDGGRMPVISG